MKRLLYKAWLITLLTRPHNVLIAALAIVVAASLSVRFTLNVTLLFTVLSAAFITAAANVVNDIYDVAIDRINRPQRVLARGALTIKTAWVCYLFFCGLGLVFAALADMPMLLIAVPVSVLLFYYSYYFKRTILLGNLVVSLVTGLAFIYGALAANDWRAGLIPGGMAFLFHLGREVIKDLQDVSGDMAEGAVTFAGKFGIIKSLLLINGIFALLIVFLFIPYLLNIYNIYYIYIVLPGVALVLAGVSLLLWFRHDSLWLGRISALLKADMLVGLTAIYAGTYHDLLAYYQSGAP